MKRQANQSSRICYSIPLVLALRNINPDGQASRGENIRPSTLFVRDCLIIASAQWSVRWYLVAAWRLVMSSVCA